MAAYGKRVGGGVGVEYVVWRCECGSIWEEGGVEVWVWSMSCGGVSVAAIWEEGGGVGVEYVMWRCGCGSIYGKRPV